MDKHLVSVDITSLNQVSFVTTLTPMIHWAMPAILITTIMILIPIIHMIAMTMLD